MSARAAAASPAPVRQFFPLSGGLDLITPALSLAPGRAIACTNYEPSRNGYRRVDGYERKDGRPAPSAASYWYMQFGSGNTALTAGQVVTGATSGANGTLLINGVLQGGSYGSSNATGYLVLTNVTGTFALGENLQVSGSTKAVSTSAATTRGATNDTDDTTWWQLAVTSARSNIGAVPGGGPLRGVWYFNGNAYAFRDNAASGATSCGMYVSSSSGWAAVNLGRSLPFTSGLTQISAGQTITGATSGATAVVTRVILISGTWGSNAAGVILFASQSGTFQSESIKVSGANVATIAGNSTANALNPGGHFDFETYDFYATTAQKCMYGCDGVSQAWEYDGTVFAPITTGIADEKPVHIAGHKNHLFLGFRNGILGSSITGSPQIWDGSRGAAEFGIGQDITGLLGEYNNQLVIACRNRLLTLSGTDVNDWDLEPFTKDAGAIEWSLQLLSAPTYCDDAGVRSMPLAPYYGNYSIGALSDAVLPLIQLKKSQGVTVTGSLRARAKSHYRLYFSDGTGLSFLVYPIPINPLQKYPPPEILPFDLTRVFRCGCSQPDANGNEILLMGSDDGYVYQLDSGLSYDGVAITYYLRLAFNANGKPFNYKRYKKLTIECDAGPSAALFLNASFTYANPDQPAVVEQDFTVSGGGAFWDETTATWDQFYWSSQVRGQAFAYIDGIGTNISVCIGGSSTFEQPHTMHGVIEEYSDRGAVK